MAKCVCRLSSKESDIEGVLFLEQSSETAPTVITGEIKGLSPGKHAFSVLVAGDLSNPPESMGAHFNPHGKQHGAPAEDERHVGSLGNIEANADGKASVKIDDNLVKLIGPLSIVGRALAVHLNEDDLGKGGSENSLINGNAGAVIAWGVVGISTQ